MHKDQNTAVDMQHCTKKPHLIDGGHLCQIKKKCPHSDRWPNIEV